MAARKKGRRGRGYTKSAKTRRHIAELAAAKRKRARNGKLSAAERRQLDEARALSPASKPAVRRPILKYLETSGGRRAVPKLDQRDLAQIERLLLQGYSKRSVGIAIGVEEHVFRFLCKDDPRVAEVVARAQGEEERELVNTLRARASDLKDKTGMAAAAFLLKARHGYREYADLHQQEHRVSIRLELPKSLTESQWGRLQAGEPPIEADAEVIDGSAGAE